MNITFDTKSNTLTIEREDQPYGGDISAKLNRHGETINLKGTSFGVTVVADGETVLDASWPPPGVFYTKTDQDVLTTARAIWMPEQTVIVGAWCVTNDGGRVEAHDEFVAPRPPQPYPSWIWEGGWQAPLPYPNDGKDYQWDEENQAWIEVTEL